MIRGRGRGVWHTLGYDGRDGANLLGGRKQRRDSRIIPEYAVRIDDDCMHRLLRERYRCRRHGGYLSLLWEYCGERERCLGATDCRYGCGAAELLWPAPIMKSCYLGGR